MKAKLLEILPEFNLIKDNALKEKTLEVWEDAMKLGGWDVSDLSKIPFTLLIPDCKVCFLDHVRGVTHVSVEGAKFLGNLYKKNLDMEFVVSGALLHDIGKLLEYKKEGGKFVKSKCGENLRHPFSGASLAFKHGIPDEICHIIAVHSKEGDHGKRSPEAWIIHHADFMNFQILK